MNAPQFDNSFARLPDAFYSRLQPTSVPSPAIIRINSDLAESLGLDADWLASPDGIGFLSGNQLPAGSDPLAMVYAGHQFGGFNPQLGDGRALLLGEVIARDGTRLDLQLKGSGQTPYSRGGDGKAPLGPVLREYLVSEAMAGLGIPTTRSLAAVSTGEVVHRDGRVPGAVLTRVAKTHIRIGTFQYFRSIDDLDSLQQLADYAIERLYPELWEHAQPYQGLLEAVVRGSASLIARWLQVGFVHGVMNTDNVQIAGETIDFGPCAFLEEFDPNAVFSSIDEGGRYGYGNQPAIGQWNATRLAEALLPLLGDDEPSATEAAEAALGVFPDEFNACFVAGFSEKLGLAAPDSEAQSDEVREFIQTTLSTMAKQKVDFTLFFRRLTQVAQGGEADSLLALFDEPSEGSLCLDDWRRRVGAGGAPEAAAVEIMRRVNPIYIPRNHRVEEAIQAGVEGDFGPFERMNEVWSKPCEERPDAADLELPASAEERVTRTFCGT